MLERAPRSRATKPTIALNMDNVVVGVDEEVRWVSKEKKGHSGRSLLENCY